MFTFGHLLMQEFGPNPQVLLMLACHRCQPDGRGNANQEKHSMLPLATGLNIYTYLVLSFIHGMPLIDSSLVLLKYSIIYDIGK